MKTITLLFLITSFYSIKSISQERYISLNHTAAYEELNFFADQPQKMWYHNGTFVSKSNEYTKGLFSISYFKQKNRKLSGFTIMPFYIRIEDEITTIYDTTSYQVIQGGNTINTKFFLNYLYSFILRDTSKRWLPYVGLSTQAFWYYSVFSPRISNRFKHQFHYFGIDLRTNIGFLLHLNDYLSISINIPFVIYEYSLLRDYIEDPTISKALRTSTEYKGNLFPNKYSILIGLAYKF